MAVPLVFFVGLVEAHGDDFAGVEQLGGFFGHGGGVSITVETDFAGLGTAGGEVDVLPFQISNFTVDVVLFH